MKEKGRILVVEDEKDMLHGLKTVLSRQGHHVECAEDGAMGLEKIKQACFDVVITDLKMPGLDGLTLLRAVKEIHTETCVIMITGFGTIETAVEAMKLGAYDYVTKPFEAQHLNLTVDKALRQLALANENKYLKSQLTKQGDFQNIIGTSPAMQAVFQLADQVAPTNTTVLILGESGTGKELFARYIHYTSPRRDKIFVPVNCGALTEALLESELFGHERGAFTGAMTRKRGLMEIASGGSFFFDEIGDVSPLIQGKLLRVLQEREFMRVGGTHLITTDIRLIAATNQDLEQRLQDKTFREDLYYRLNVVRLSLPPLRERLDDLLPLAQFFLRRFNQRMHKEICCIAPAVLDLFAGYHWPGNVRELENVMERAVVLASDDMIEPSHLPAELLKTHNPGAPACSDLTYKDAKKQVVDAFSQQYIQQVLLVSQGNVSEAARRSGMDCANFRRLMRKYGLRTKSCHEG